MVADTLSAYNLAKEPLQILAIEPAVPGAFETIRFAVLKT